MKVILTIVFLIAVFPFFMILVMGTWDNDKLMQSLPFFFSDYFGKNVMMVLKSNFFIYYSNSLIVSLSAIILASLSSSLIGFAIAKYNFKLKKAISIFVIVIMMVPQQVSIVGYILEMRNFRLTNTLLPIILIWIASPFCAFFMTQYMKGSVPNEVIESARMDGCSEPRIYTSIVLPFIKPGIATISTLVFLWSWNSYMLPLIAISKQRWYTIPLFITTIGAEYRDDYGARMAALTLAVFPVLIVFSICSKAFIKGISAGAVKG